MPPHNFSSTGNQAAPVHIPKATQARLKDVTIRIRTALLGNSAESDLKAADTAIYTLLDDPNVSVVTGAEALQLKTQIASKLNGEVVDTFLKDMDQRDPVKLAILVGFLDQLGELIGASSIMMEWWDLVLRPILKDPHASDRIASQARNLAVMAATAAPASAYKDEPPPVPTWPMTSEAVQARKIGGAPYPKASAEPTKAPIPPPSAGRSSATPTRGDHPNSRKAKLADAHRRFTQRLFDLYLQEASAPLGRNENDDEKLDALEQMQQSAASLVNQEGGDGTSRDDKAAKSTSYMWNAVQAENLHPVDIASTAWKGNLEAILITFGEQRPKEFFHHLSTSFEEPMHRIPILLLLTIFLRINSLHTYHITKTALVQDIVMSLQLDTSTTLISLCITALIILIPHIPNWIANGGAGGLPVFLSIYARIVDWRKLGPGWENRVGDGDDLDQLRQKLDEEYGEIDRLSKRLAVRAEVEWARLESSVDTDLTAEPDATRYFTILYGIFPCNMVRFLRAPIDYLRKADYNAPLAPNWEDLIEESTVQLRSQPILRKHTCHPSLMDSTAEKEITDKQRWVHHDAADITAECISLSVEGWQSSLAMTEGYSHYQLHGQHSELYGDRLAFATSSTARPARRNSASGASASSRAESPIDTRRSVVRPEAGDTPRQTIANEILSSYTDLRWGGAFRRKSAAEGASRSPSRTPLVPRLTTLGNVGAHTELDHSLRALDLDVIPSAELAPSLPVSPTRTSSPAFPARGRTIAPNTRPMFRSPFASMKPPQLANAIISPPSSRATSVSHQAATRVDEGVAPSTVTGVLEPAQAPSQRAARLEVYAELKYLQRENLLLRNELNFELYLKDQHLHHIGRLHRDRITDNALEAERQNLYQIVKSLRTQVAELTATQDRQRSESSTTKARHAQWENELNAKLKSYREERKTWTTESRELKAELEQCHATISSQARRLDETSSEMFEVRRQLNEMVPKVAKVNEYEAKTLHLTKCLTYWDDDVKKYEVQRREMEILLSRWKEMELLLEASEADRWKLAEEAEYRRVAAEQLSRELKIVKERAADSVTQARLAVSGPASDIDKGVISASRRKLEELEEQVLALQARAHDAEAETQYVQSLLDQQQQESSSSEERQTRREHTFSPGTLTPSLAPSAPTAQISTTSTSTAHATGTLESVASKMDNPNHEGPTGAAESGEGAAAIVEEGGPSAAELQRILDEEVQPLHLGSPKGGSEAAIEDQEKTEEEAA
ncbi:unnamed protein product [Sympodiomycopsis kandeliae]